MLFEQENDSVVLSYEFEKALKNELASTGGRENLFLRSSTGLSSYLKELGRQHGQAYFRYVLQDAYEYIYNCDDHDSISIETRNRRLLGLARATIERLRTANETVAPSVLRQCCQYMLNDFKIAFPACENSVNIVVGNFLFLRVLCPSIVKPELLDMPSYPNKLCLANAVQLAKVLQHTLTGTMFHQEQSGSKGANVFIAENRPVLSDILKGFPVKAEIQDVTLSSSRQRRSTTSSLKGSTVIERQSDESSKSYCGSENKISSFNSKDLVSPITHQTPPKKKVSKRSRFKFWTRTVSDKL